MKIWTATHKKYLKSRIKKKAATVQVFTKKCLALSVDFFLS